GAIVAAVPDAGYRFVQWSDGITSASRTDTDVIADLSVTAEFVEQLAPPEAISLGLVGGDLVISWAHVPDADSYNLYYAREPGVTPQNYDSLDGGHALTGVTNPHVLAGLADGERYYFVMTTVINGEESSVGEVASVLSPHAPWLMAPHRGHLAVDINTTKASIDWPAEPGRLYSLYITADPETNLANYASHGAELRLN